MTDSPTSNERSLPQRIATRVVEAVCELPDYNSPDDQPDLVMCTVQQLEHCVLQAFEQLKYDREMERGPDSSRDETSHERATFIELLNLAEHFLAERQPESDERALRKRIADALTQAPAVKTSDDELALMRAKLERLQRWAAKAGHFPECAHWKPWTQKGCTCGLVDLMLSLPVEPKAPLPEHVHSWDGDQCHYCHIPRSSVENGDGEQ